MIRLSKTQVIAMHDDLILETGGVTGLRDENLLEAALNSPFQSFDGFDIYNTIQQKAARLGFGLVQNHAFIDGNKRIAAHVMLVFLALNDIELEYKQNELSSLFLGLASSEISCNELIEWIYKHQIL